jgi:putative chitinase
MTIILTADVLARCTGSTIGRAAARVTAYNQAFELYGINTRLRVAFLLANVGHECGGFLYSREIWGPTPVQSRYEGREDLGNTQPGDGFKFRGAGDLQITGRFNFAAARDRLRKRFHNMAVPDFEQEPEEAASPRWAALLACDYIERSGANKYADAMNFDAYCDLINRGRATLTPGDTNGFQHRLRLAEIAIRVLP